MSHRSHTAIALCGLLVLACGRDLGAGWLQDYRTSTEVLSASAVRLAGGDIALICEQRGRPALVLRTDAGGNLASAIDGLVYSPVLQSPRLGAMVGGGFFAAGMSYQGGENRATLMRMDASGQAGFGVYPPDFLLSDDHWFNDIAVRAGGTAVAVGSIRESLGLSFLHGWVVEVAATGAPLWGVAIGNPTIDERWFLLRVVATPDGGFAALGYKYEVTGPRSWVVKFAGDRSIEWQRFLEPAGGGDPTALAVTASSDLAVAGKTRSSPPAIWFAVLDPSGALLTARAYRDILPATARAITTDPAGGFLIAGERGTRSQDQQAVLMRVSDGGDLLWGRGYQLGTIGSWASVWRNLDATLVVGGQLGDAPSLAGLDGLGILGAPCVVESAFAPITEVLSVAISPAPGVPLPEKSRGGILSRAATREVVYSCPCQVPPAVIAGLEAVRTGDDAVFSWVADPAAPGYNLWTVPRKEEIDLARRSSAPSATGVAGCSPPAPVSGASCTDPGAIARGSPGILFYQVRGDCPPSGEGP